MDDGKSSEEVVILPYKDAYLKDLIDAGDMRKFLENPQLKRELDRCLNRIRNPKEK